MFIISKSTDGVSFKETGRVAGSGNAIGMMNYSFTDAYPQNGENYYRLEQQDIDGGVNNLGLKFVNFDWNKTSLTAYPNQLFDMLT